MGEYKFTGKTGILEYVEQAGCIQYDPIDVCGKNPELVLQSRIKGFQKGMLYKLLYQDRSLIDYFDKMYSSTSSNINYRNVARVLYDELVTTFCQQIAL